MNNEERDIQIRTELKDAYDIYLEKQGIEIPKPELSFMEENKNKTPAWKRFAKAAVFVLAILVASSGIALWIDSGSASASKSGIEKVMNKLSNGVFTTEQSEISLEEQESILTLNDEKDIEKAKAFLPELMYPYYIPEGFKFSGLMVSKKGDGSRCMEYTYTGVSGEELRIHISYDPDEEIEVTGDTSAEENLEICRNIDVYTSKE